MLLMNRARRIAESLRFLATKSVKVHEPGPVYSDNAVAHFTVKDLVGRRFRITVQEESDEG